MLIMKCQGYYTEQPSDRVQRIQSYPYIYSGWTAICQVATNQTPIGIIGWNGSNSEKTGLMSNNTP